ncbi:MAG: hypothetical protein KDH15_15780, partial [Rhodocyclaceae bacterium]|nr:hypothetical protein [Rhodocyclaceae bacterium]
SVSGGAQAGGSAAVSATVSLTAAGFVNVMATGVLAIDVALSVSGGAQPGGVANLQLVGAAVLARTAGFVVQSRPRPFRVAAARSFRVSR